MLNMDDLIADYGDSSLEASRCREDCALFDFSFVRRVRVSGSKVIESLQAFQPRSVHDMAVGQIRYSVKCDESDRVRSDLTIWRFSKNCFEVMSGHVDDVIALQALADENFKVKNLSETNAILAIQGPNSLSRLDAYTDTALLAGLPYFGFVETSIIGIPCLIGRLGYSGEAGFEILFDASRKKELWDRLSSRIYPAGFNAVDILRIEAGFFLFTRECIIRPTIAELGLSALIRAQKVNPAMQMKAFTAKAVEKIEINSWKSQNLRNKRPQCGEICITSACFSPVFDSIIGLGFVSSLTKTTLVVDPENIFYDIETFLPPLYDPHKIRPRKLLSGHAG